MPTIRIDARSTDHIALQQTDVATITQPAGVRLTCTAGFAWVTQGKEARDLVLYPGQALVLDHRKPVYVSALQPCSLRIQAPPIQAGFRERTIALLSAWLRRPVGATA